MRNCVPLQCNFNHLTVDYRFTKIFTFILSALSHSCSSPYFTTTTCKYREISNKLFIFVLSWFSFKRGVFALQIYRISPIFQPNLWFFRKLISNWWLWRILATGSKVHLHKQLQQTAVVSGRDRLSQSSRENRKLTRSIREFWWVDPRKSTPFWKF